LSSNTQMPTEAPKKRRGGLRFAFLYFVGTAVVVTLVALAAPGPDEAAGEQAAPTTSRSASRQEAPPAAPGEEPAADAAEVILPSVVHIKTSTGIGSGVVYRPSGLIVTAAHVLAEDETVTVRFDNGELAEGKVMGVVPDADVAVIEVDMDGLPAATFNVDKPRVGQMAVAVGSPWGLEATVTAGIVSAVDQANCLFNGCVSMVQTDAAINPGNSGGPLVDRDGSVLGLNVSIFTGSGASDGVGFAVPSSVVVDYAESIITGEPIEIAFLGVQGDVDPTLSDGHAGAMIAAVIEGTAAEAVGVEEGDVIIFLDGVAIQDLADLQAQMRMHRPGDAVELRLIRDGKEIALDVTLGTRPDDSG